MRFSLKSIGTLFFLASFLVSLRVTALAAAADTPLFEKGLETFVVKDVNGKTPTFRILNGAASEKALALAIVTTLNLAPDTEKLPVKEYIDVKIEELNFQTITGKPDELKMIAKISGRYLEIPKPVDRAKFVSGAVIDMAFPLTQKNVALFDVKSDGKIKFRLKADRKEVQILNGEGHLNYTAPLMGSGEEKIRFTGTAARQIEAGRL